MFEYTIEEKNAVIDKFFISRNNLKLLIFPKKQKHKYLCFLWIQSLFVKKRYYTEKEVNIILKDVYQDYVMIRRYLVDYGLLEREKDGSRYWKNKDYTKITTADNLR